MSPLDEIRARTRNIPEQYLGQTEKDRALLLAALDNVEALATAWEARGKHLMNYSEECPESVKHELYEQGEEMADNARKIRAEIEAAFTPTDRGRCAA